jgi:glycosyltransferase involved in cell wall biosynthesis
LLFFEIDYARSRGAVFIWTFHNLAPHDIRHPRLAEWCAGRLVRRIDGAIFLSAVSKSQALNKYPQLCHVESVVIQHGDYRPVLRQALENHHAKKRLGIPEMAPTVGFIGSIRPYKKLGSLIEAFRALEDPSARLLIAGRPDDSFEVLQALREAKKEPRVILRLGLLPEHELQEAVTACDLVVFPYRDPINSGSVIYALSNHRPVLVHRCESMVELAKQVIGDSVLFFNSEVSGSDIFKALLQAKTYKGEVCLTLPSWKRIAELYLDFLTSLNPRGGLIKYAKRNAKRP